MKTISRSTALAVLCSAVAVPHIARAQNSTVRVGASPAATQAEAYYAEQLGIFKAAGISTTQTIVTRSSDSLAAVIAGDLDVGSTTPQAIGNAIIHGIPIRVIATGAVYAGNPPPVQLFVAKNSTLSDAKSFENSTFAVQTLNDTQTLGMLVWLQQNKVDTTKIKFIEMPFSTMAAALARGEVAGACIVEPFASAHKDEVKAIPHVYDDLGKDWALGAWFARRDWIEKNPALVKSFVQAIYTTAKRVNADPASINALLSAYSKVSPEAARTTPHPIFAEMPERSNIEPQMIAAARFKLVSRLVTYREMTGG